MSREISVEQPRSGIFVGKHRNLGRRRESLSIGRNVSVAILPDRVLSEKLRILSLSLLPVLLRFESYFLLISSFESLRTKNSNRGVINMFHFIKKELQFMEYFITRFHKVYPCQSTKIINKNHKVSKTRDKRD